MRLFASAAVLGALTVVAILAVVVTTPALGQDDGPSGGAQVPECIEYSGQARYGAYGYDHVVHVRNGCERRARCQVWTSVDSERHAISVAAGDTRDVVTRRGSPARGFRPYARCELED